jgi:hypothetical protein
MPHSLLTHPVRDQLYFMGFFVRFINMRTCNCLHGLLLLLCLMNRRCNWPVNRLTIEEKHRQEEIRSCPKWRVVVYVLCMTIKQIPITRNAMTTLENKFEENLDLWSNNLKFWRNGRSLVIERHLVLPKLCYTCWTEILKCSLELIRKCSA